jgi:hypothetical protein
MAYRERLWSAWSLKMFLPDSLFKRAEDALAQGRPVEMEHTSFNDPGPDHSRVLIDGKPVFTIPGF